MNEGDKRCGLGTFLPMACRGRAEAFARRLHNRLRSLGSQDGDGGGPPSSENSWLAGNEITNSIVTNRQPRLSLSESDIFMDLGIFDTPGSPDEELTEHEYTKFITNPSDNLHECGCIAKRNSMDSDSSDGPYYDTENSDVTGAVDHNQTTTTVTTNGLLTNNHHTLENITETTELKEPEENHRNYYDVENEEQHQQQQQQEEEKEILVVNTDNNDVTVIKEDNNQILNNGMKEIDLERLISTDGGDDTLSQIPLVSTTTPLPAAPSPSECTLSSLSQNVSVDDEQFEDVPFDGMSIPVWQMNFDQKITLNCNGNNNNNNNNNIYSAIDLESLRNNLQSNSNCCSSSSSCSSGNGNNNNSSSTTTATATATATTSCNSDNNNIKDFVNISNSPPLESYCSHLEVNNDLTIECPCTTIECCTSSTSTSLTSNPMVQVSTSLEIKDLDDDDDDNDNNEINCRQQIVGKQNAIENCPCTSNELPEVNSDDKNYLNVTTITRSDLDDIETEERMPRVRRCSSLKTGKTPPGTPGRKKIVRFADVLGLDLADVRTFLDEVPKIPISAYDDLSGAELSLSDDTGSSCSMISLNNCGSLQLTTKTKTLMPLFEQPGGRVDFFDRVKMNQVCLENAYVDDTIALCVCGTVRVRNLDFHKSVHIRYTLDQWKSFADLQATYVENSCDGFSDKFSFTLYVHTLTVGQRLEFAVRFQCKGCQYWDSNNDTNYCFQCMPLPSQSTTSLSSYSTAAVAAAAATTTSNTNHNNIADEDTHWEGAAFYYDNSVNLQTTVQEIVTQSLVTSKCQTQISMETLTAITVLFFAFIFIYIQKIIYFRSPSTSPSSS